MWENNNDFNYISDFDNLSIQHNVHNVQKITLFWLRWFRRKASTLPIAYDSRCKFSFIVNLISFAPILDLFQFMYRTVKWK